MSERITNVMKTEFAAKSINESYARSAVAAFAALCDPSVSVIADIKTVVSEAVTNAIVHGYAGIENKQECVVSIVCKMTESGKLIIRIKDKGRGIEDIHTAMQPLYTTDTVGERSGMGFTVMQSFTDAIRVRSSLGKGTVVTLEKRLKR
jgi:stage II sporulation protein AB (anti-sigma F factor)